MRYAALLLLAVSGACNFDPFANVLPANIEFLSASVSPTMIAAGGQFIAVARVKYDNCHDPRIDVMYAGLRVEQTGDAFRASFVAVLGETVVSFSASCAFAGAGPIAVDIQVTPAP